MNICKKCYTDKKHPKHDYLRKCRDCGLEAHSIEELDLFIQNPQAKYRHRNRCKKCNILRTKKRLNNMSEEEHKKLINYFRTWENTNQNRINRRMNKINFKGKNINQKTNPRKNICSVCSMEYPNDLSYQTHIHHWFYGEDPLGGSLELCMFCHNKLPKTIWVECECGVKYDGWLYKKCPICQSKNPILTVEQHIKYIENIKNMVNYRKSLKLETS